MPPLLPPPLTTLESLPPDIIYVLLTKVSALDYFPLKLAGSRYITGIVREFTCRLPRVSHLHEIQKEDARRKGLRPKKMRFAMEIMLERHQVALVLYYKRKQQWRMERKGDDYDNDKNRINNGIDGMRPMKPRETVKRVFRAALHWAAWYGAENAVRLLLDRTNVRDWKSGWTALHIAAVNGQMDVVKILLSSGMKINALDFKGKTALQLALDHGHMSVAAYLRGEGGREPKKNLDEEIRYCRAKGGNWRDLFLTQSECVSSLSGPTSTPLSYKMPLEKTSIMDSLLGYCMAKNGVIGYGVNNETKSLLLSAIYDDYPIVVDAVLDDGFDINATIKTGGGTNALHVAAREGRSSIVEILLDRGADINRTTTGGHTALHESVWVKGGGATQAILNRGFPVDTRNIQQNETALHMAARNGVDCAMEILLRYGADVELQSNLYNLRPLHLAAKHPKCMQLLLDAGAKIEAQTDNKCTPLVFANIYGDGSNSTRLLLDHGADFNVTNDNGETVLHLAIKATINNEDRWVVAEALLEAGANPNARDKNGRTPVYQVYQAVKERIPYVNSFEAEIAKLLKHGADLNIKDSNGRALLHSAFLSRDMDIVIALLNSGADVNATDAKGHTILHHSIYRKYNDSDNTFTSIVTLLLRFGVQLDAKDNGGCTALDLAIRDNKVEYAETLNGFMEAPVD